MSNKSVEQLYKKIEGSSNNRSVGGGEAFKVANAQTDILIREVDFGAAKTVLDYGCGIGRTMPLLFEKLARKDVSIDGCDISEDFIKECRVLYEQYPFRFFKIYAENPHYSNFNVSEAEEHIPSNFYDIAYSYSVFTHLTLQMALDVLKRVNGYLKTGGQYYFTLFRLDDGSLEAMNSGRPLPFSFSKKVREDQEEYFADDNDPLAFAALQKRAIESAVGEAGFEISKFLAGSWRGIGAPNIHDAYVVVKK